MHRTVITTSTEPDDLVRPGPVEGDGHAESYFTHAGGVTLERSGGVMHRVSAGPVADARVGLTPEGLAVALEMRTAVDAVATLEVRRSALDPVREWPVSDVVRVPWAAIGVAAGDQVHLRVVVRNSNGHIVQMVPADGVDRLLMVPGADLNGRRWRA